MTLALPIDHGVILVANLRCSSFEGRRDCLRRQIIRLIQFGSR